MKPNNILLSALLASALTANAQVKINVDVANPGVKVSPNLYGIFFEDINHAADGGLYAELISNRSFEDSDNTTPTWRTKAADGATISTQLVSKALLNNAQGKALQINVAARQNATASLVNEGFWGINAVQGRTYKLSLWAKGSYKGGVKARLISADGKSVYAETAVDAKMGKKWSKFTAELTANANDPKAQFELVFDGKGTIEASTLHIAKTNETIIADWQTFSNIEAENNVAAIAVLGYMHEWQAAHLFVGVRNVNEDFFTSDITAFFISSSCGIFPTIAASYPIANYPFSGLTVYFDVSRGGWTFRNSLYNGTGYNGWKRGDNPFLVRPAKDGVFNISQLEYAHSGAHYFAGVAVHSRQYTVGTDGEMPSADAAAHKTTCAWWAYAEQPMWSAADRCVTCMAQYSENTCRQSVCYRYAEVGCAYCDSLNQCGLSAQCARFRQGTEHSVELTYRRQLNRHIALQPSFQYINNAGGNFTALCARLYYSF